MGPLIVLCALLLLFIPVAAQADEGLPLRSTRTFRLDTDEGTWISLDVSPDGKVIVFDLLGDLYLLPMEGGDARSIRPGMAFDSQPVFSPDGKWIAYVSDADGSENLWIARADGSEPRQLSRDRDRDFVSPRWHPQGGEVLVSRGLGGRNVHEIWAYGVAGGEPRQVAASNQRRENLLGAVLSPDGRNLYFAQRQGAFSWDPRPPIFSIYRQDLATGEKEQIADRPGSAFSPRLSPDGRWLVYGTRAETQTGLRIRELETGRERWLKFPVQRDDQESLASRDVLPGYAFTPDGEQIVLAYGGRIRRFPLAGGAEVPVPFRARASIDIGPLLDRRERVEDGPGVRAHLIQNPRLSPDGRRVVFSALGHLYLMDPWGSPPRRLTSGDTFEFQPAWSPDGSQIAYVTWSPQGGHLEKLSPGDGSAPRRVSEFEGFYSEPVWSPDGTRIVALASSTEARQAMLDGMAQPRSENLVWLPQEGGKPQRVAPAGGVIGPHFTTDPERIYVSSAYGVQSIAFDGSAEKSHFSVLGKGLAGGPARSPTDNVRISPDGSSALALVNQQLYLVPLAAPGRPAAAGPAPDSGAGLAIDVADPAAGARRLSELGADDFSWGEGGKSILWSLGATLYRQRTEALDRPAEVFAVELEIPRDRPLGSVLLRGARVVTLRGDQVIENADLLIRGNRIAAVGGRGDLALPAGTPVIELAGKTIVPGFIDIHAHWHELMVGPIDRQPWPLWVSLAFGITASRDPQSRTLDLFLYQDLVEAGEILGPRLFTTGPAIFSNTPIDGYPDAVAVARRYRDFYRTHLLKAYTTGDRRIRQWIVQASDEVGMRPTTEGAMDLKLELTHAIDGFSGNEHALPVVPIFKDVVQLFAQTGIYYTPTLVLSYGGPLGENYFYESSDLFTDPKMRRFVPRDLLEARALRRSWYHPREHIFPQLAKAAADIAAAGGKVCLGGHGQLQGIQAHWEMWALASGGMPPLEVLRSASLRGAEAMGLEADLGSIEAGKLADLVILDRNPLEDIRNTTSIRQVMKNGRLYDGDTLDQVWPRAESREAPWWWQNEPQPPPRESRPGPRPGGAGGPLRDLIGQDRDPQ